MEDPNVLSKIIFLLVGFVVIALATVGALYYCNKTLADRETEKLEKNEA